MCTIIMSVVCVFTLHMKGNDHFTFQGVYNRWTGPVDWTGGLESCGKNVVDLC